MIEFNYNSDVINADIKCKLEGVDEAKFKAAALALILHLENWSSISKNIPEIGDKITEMRGKFLNDVLKIIVQVSQALGNEVPDHVIQQITAEKKCESWLDENEESEENNL